jgi:DNA-binding CsgD family transcriptional regulator
VLLRSDAGISKRPLARIQRLCCFGVGSEMLMPDLIRDLTGAISSSGGWFHWMAPGLGIVNSYATFPSSLTELYFRDFYQTRYETEAVGDVTNWPASSGLEATHRKPFVDKALLRTDYYNCLWRPAGIHEYVVATIRDAGHERGRIHLYRSAGKAHFEPKDLKMLQSVVGFIRHAMVRVTLDDGDYADSEDRALCVVDKDGKVRHAEAEAQRLLMMALNPRWNSISGIRGLHEPLPEITQLCQVLIATANGRVGQPPPVLRLRNPWGEFVLRAYWLGPTDGMEQTRQIGITVERRVPRALALRPRVEDLPLTGREKQLCLLLTQDRSRQELGEAMGVSTGTVISHQSSIYTKLGVHSRAELLTALAPD